MGEHPRIGVGRGTLAALFCVVIIALLAFISGRDQALDAPEVVAADEEPAPVQSATLSDTPVAQPEITAQPDAPAAEVASVDDATQSVEGDAEAVAVPEDAKNPTDDTAPDTPQEPVEVEADPAAAPAPGFDVVRVDAEGSAVVAGTAAPNAMVTIMDGPRALAEVEADGSGSFVAVFDAGPSRAPRALTLNAVTPDGTASISEDVVVLLPRDADGAIAEEEVAAPGTEENADETTSDSATPEPETSGDGGEIAATAIIRDGDVEVVTNEPLENVSQAQVKLSSISYSETGEVTLAGLGLAGSPLRVYVDATLAGEGRVGDDGRWVMILSDVEEGLYVLRVDQLDENGSVISRIETPFKREFPEVAVGPGGSSGLVGTGGAPVSVTVQPGGNLWTLARIHYGSGVLYTQIFTANSDLIRDPDLIFPGQVLAIPGLEEAQ